jgi:predicted nuclease with TOPRIM domain
MATDYEERFRAAELPKKLNEVEERLGALSDDQANAIQDHYPDRLARLRAAILALRPRIEASDPLIVPEHVLEQTNGSLTAVINALNAYNDDGNIEHFVPLDGWVDPLVAAVPLWPAPADIPSSDASEVASRFRRSAGQQLRGLTTDFEKVEELVAALQSDLEQRSGEWGEQKTTLESQLQELGGTIDQQRGRLDQAIESYQGQFSEAQERRNEEHRQQLSSLESQTSELEGQLKQGIDQTLSEAQEKTKVTLEELRGELTKAQEITSFVGGTSTAAGYGKEAKSQKRIADGLRGLAIAFGLAAAGLAVWAVIHAQEDADPSLTVVVAKTVVSLVFAGLAGYVATQSGHHRAREENARRRELDLLALPAFIATLPDEEKEEITGQVATRLFLSPVPTDSKSEPALTKESISLISLLLDAVRKS